MVTIPFLGNANLLVELIKPPLSSNFTQPSLQLAARSSGHASSASFAIPGLSAINPSDFLTAVRNESCACKHQEVVFGKSLEHFKNSVSVTGKLLVPTVQLLHPISSQFFDLPECAVGSIRLIFMVGPGVQQRKF